MGEEDYRSTGSGGLKLKGVKDGRVDKKHKKKKGKVSPKPDAEKEDLPGSQILDEPLRDDDRGTKSDAEQHTPSEEAGETVGKTEAERKHEETRRKRLNERLKREGSKTHKERVEELNRHLSGLSEHHDMPRIGPG